MSLAASRAINAPTSEEVPRAELIGASLSSISGATAFGPSLGDMLHASNDSIQPHLPELLQMRWTSTTLTTLAFALVASTASAQSTKPLGPVDGHELAPTEIERVAVGMPAPDFTLAKYGGGTVTLSSLRGKKNVVLVFYRGYWCPFCIKQLTGMRQLLDAELKKSTELLVVAIDNDDETKQTVTRISADGAAPDFTFLSDPEHAVIARYGILNPAGTRRGIPHPATYVIDQKGVVRWRDVETDYKIRPTNDAILTAVKALPAR